MRKSSCISILSVIELRSPFFVLHQSLTMVRFTTLLLPVLSLVGASIASASSAVKELTPSNFESTVFAGTPSLVEFFAPWYDPLCIRACLQI